MTLDEQEREERIAKLGPVELWGRRRQPTPEDEEATKALRDLRAAIEAKVEPLLRWLNAKMERWT